MPVDITLPDLGENISEGGVLELKVKPGDIVKPEDVIVVIEAEKSTVEVPAGVAGKVIEVVAQKNQKVKTGAILARVEGNSSAAPKRREAGRTRTASGEAEGARASAGSSQAEVCAGPRGSQW